MSAGSSRLLYFPYSQFSKRFGDQFFTFKILSWTYHNNPICSFDGLYVVYQVQISLGNHTWVVWKRFSEFVSFHCYLKQKYTRFESTLPFHPPKTCTRVIYDKRFLEERKYSLETYFDKVLRLLSEKDCFSDAVVIKFLQLSNDVRSGEPNSL
jgi:hypothetical protein